MKNIKIIIVDDHTLFRELLSYAFQDIKGIEIIGEAGSGKAAIELSLKLNPDVVLMGISLPILNGMEATRQIVAQRPEIKIIALSMHSSRQFVIGMLNAGAMGYLLKSCSFDQVQQGIRSVATGEIFLCADIASLFLEHMINPDDYLPMPMLDKITDREIEVLKMIAEGYTNKSIAEKLDVAKRTIDMHRMHIKQKLKLESTAELVKFAICVGLTTHDIGGYTFPLKNR